MRPRHSVLLLCSCFAAALPAQGIVNQSLLQAPADDGAAPDARRSPSLVAVEKSRAAVVRVFVEVDGPRGKFAIERPSSGVCVDKSGLVLTWARLVAESVGAADKQLYVQLDDAAHTRSIASIVRIDAPTGLALLQVKPPEAGMTAVELGAATAAAGEAAVVLCLPEGKDLLAFAGVASPALADVKLGGRTFPAGGVFLTDSRNDLRCDGGAVLDAAGRLIGLYASEHVRRDVAEPKLEDLKAPSFGVVLPMGVVRKAFAQEFAGAAVTNTTLRTAPAATPPSRQVAAVQRIAPSVVGVWGGAGDWPVFGADDPGAVQRRPGLGSGVVLSASGLVVTCAHLCPEDKVRLRLADGRTFPAKVLARHAEANLMGGNGTNLALVLAELPAGTSLTPAACETDDDVVLGETVLAVGNPAGTRPVVTAGVLSALRQSGRLQADPNLGNQNGGGAVVDATGRLLGIADTGETDAIDLEYAMRGDKVTTETNLSTFLGIRRVRKLFAKEIAAHAAAEESIRSTAKASDDERRQRESALTAMVAKTSKAMLNIYVGYSTAKVDEESNPFAEAAEAKVMPLSLGSGVIIDRTGLAISNWHVVDDATEPDGSMRKDHKVEARVFGGKKYEVKVLSISRENDLSLLQLVLSPGEEVQAVELGNSDALRIGECVAAIGNPHGAANTITFGVVSAKEQELRVKGRWAKLEHLIETDAAINGGNSGGALLDMNGRLVGINSAGGGTFTNRGYAIAVDHVRAQVLGLLLQAYKLRSPDLGMRVIDDGGKVVVMDVDPRGPAAKAGLQAGDRITSAAGVAISWSPGFAMTLRQQPLGSPMPLVIDRKGTAKSLALMPVDPGVWAVIRQSGLECRTFGFREEPELVRKAAIALHRKLTGDANAEPQEIPEYVVRVDAVHAGTQPDGVDVRPGDLLLAVELRDDNTAEPVFVRFADVAAIKDLFNDRRLGTYEGQQFHFLIARGGEIREADITAKRLFW
jgi:S1-C subfamily serine protease